MPPFEFAMSRRDRKKHQSHQAEFSLLNAWNAVEVSYKTAIVPLLGNHMRDLLRVLASDLHPR
jgi:hypothetical protein